MHDKEAEATLHALACPLDWKTHTAHSERALLRDESGSLTGFYSVVAIGGMYIAGITRSGNGIKSAEVQYSNRQSARNACASHFLTGQWEPEPSVMSAVSGKDAEE